MRRPWGTGRGLSRVTHGNSARIGQPMGAGASGAGLSLAPINGSYPINNHTSSSGSSPLPAPSQGPPAFRCRLSPPLPLPASQAARHCPHPPIPLWTTCNPPHIALSPGTLPHYLPWISHSTPHGVPSVADKSFLNATTYPSTPRNLPPPFRPALQPLVSAAPFDPWRA